MQNRPTTEYSLPLLKPAKQTILFDTDVKNYIAIWEKIINSMPNREEKMILEQRIKSIKTSFQNYLDEQKFEGFEYRGVGGMKEIEESIKQFEAFIEKNNYINNLFPLIDTNNEISSLVNVHNNAILEAGKKADALADAEFKKRYPEKKAEVVPPPANPAPIKTTKEQMSDLRKKIQDEIDALNVILSSTEIHQAVLAEIKTKIIYHQQLLYTASEKATSQNELEEILSRHVIWKEDILPQMLKRYGIEGYPLPLLNPAQQEITSSDLNAYIKTWEDIIKLMPDVEEKINLKAKLEILKAATGNDLTYQLGRFQNFIKMKSYCDYLLPLIDTNNKILSLITNHNIKMETPAKTEAVKTTDVEEYPLPLLSPPSQKKLSIPNVNNYIKTWENIITLMPDSKEKVALDKKLNTLKALWNDYLETPGDLGQMRAYVDRFQDFVTTNNYHDHILPSLDTDKKILAWINGHNRIIQYDERDLRDAADAKIEKTKYDMDAKKYGAPHKSSSTTKDRVENAQSHEKKEEEVVSTKEETPFSGAALTTSTVASAPNEAVSKENNSPPPRAPKSKSSKPLSDKDQLIIEVEQKAKELEREIRKGQNSLEKLQKHTALLATILYLKNEMSHEQLVGILKDNAGFVKPDGYDRSQAEVLIRKAHILMGHPFPDVQQKATTKEHAKEKEVVHDNDKEQYTKISNNRFSNR